MDRIWNVNIEDKDYMVAVDYGAFGRDPEDTTVEFAREGKLLIDGNEVQTWESKLPKKIHFDIGGKPAVLHKKGLFAKKLELFLEGEQIKPATRD